MKKIFFFIIIIGYSGILFSQNVGIGTITPLEKLSVVTNYGYGISHEANSIKLSSYIDLSGAWLGTITNHPFHFYTNNGTAQMSLLQNGNVGIGTFTPLSKLHILTESAGGVTPNTGSHLTIENNNNLYMSFLTPDNRENGVLFGLNSNNSHGGIIYNNPSAPGGLLFRTNGNVNRMAIDMNGNVGIGTTNPSEKMQVNGNVKANSFEYTSPKTFYYSIPPAAFTTATNPTTLTSTDAVYCEANDGSAFIEDGYNGFVAPVNLPDGATVTSMKVYFVDNSAEDNLEFVLRRRLHESDTYITMCTIITSGTPGNSDLSSSTISFPVINNLYHNFTITAIPAIFNYWPDSLLKIKAILITYTMPQVH